MENPEQRSDEWFLKRLGRFTGSEVGVLMGYKEDSEFSKTAMDYIYKVAGERDILDSYKDPNRLFKYYRDQVEVSSKSTDFGIEQEPIARAKYERITGIKMLEVSSCVYKPMPYFAASPDGFHCSDKYGVGVLELKTLSFSNFFKYKNELYDNESFKKIGTPASKKYYWQCIAEMICTNSQWCDFSVFNPFLNHPMHITRIYPLEEDVSALLSRIQLANEIVEEILNK